MDYSVRALKMSIDKEWGEIRGSLHIMHQTPDKRRVSKATQHLWKEAIYPSISGPRHHDDERNCLQYFKGTLLHQSDLPEFVLGIYKFGNWRKFPKISLKVFPPKIASVQLWPTNRVITTSLATVTLT